MGTVTALPVSQLPTATAPVPRLTILRNAAKMTQRSLAERLGVAPVTVRRWEHGAVPIPDDYLLRIAHELKVSVSFLLGHEAKEPDESTVAILAELRDALENTARRLPTECEWRWVAAQFAAALRRSLDG